MAGMTVCHKMAGRTWYKSFVPFEAIATGWTVQGSNPSGGEIYRNRPDRPWGPPSLLYNGYRVCFPGVKRPGRGVDHPLPSSVWIKERVELYLYSPSGPSWPVVGRPLPLTFEAISLLERRLKKTFYIKVDYTLLHKMGGEMARTGERRKA
jgi:hypothetical protein